MKSLEHGVVGLEVAPEATVFNKGLVERPTLKLDAIGGGKNSGAVRTPFAMDVERTLSGFQGLEIFFVVCRRWTGLFSEGDFDERNAVGGAEGPFHLGGSNRDDGFDALFLQGFQREVFDVDFPSTVEVVVILYDMVVQPFQMAEHTVVAVGGRRDNLAVRDRCPAHNIGSFGGMRTGKKGCG